MNELELKAAAAAGFLTTVADGFRPWTSKFAWGRFGDGISPEKPIDFCGPWYRFPCIVEFIANPANFGDFGVATPVPFFGNMIEACNTPP
jgi:hypothetical protein